MKSKTRAIQRFQVALLIETSNAYSREVLRGVRSYLREHQRPWATFLTEHGRGEMAEEWLGDWKGDGIIARIENETIESAIRQKKLPTVNVSATGLAPEIPCVCTDSRAVSRMAAQHLIERGFRRFAYYANERFDWSVNRGEYFIQALREEGLPCAVYPMETGPGGMNVMEPDRERLAKWVSSLPKPVGIFTSLDIRGLQLLEACRRAKVDVPNEAGVIGVHNDELMCDLAEPPLSSVAPNAKRTGYEAARILDSLMEGNREEVRVHHIKPIRVAIRQSTDVLAVEDPHIARAVRIIRERACEGIGVEAILEEVPLSRTVLERQFKKYLGCTPHEQILKIKLARVKEMLILTDLPLARIAERTGFRHVEYLSVVFKKKEGCSPSRFRLKNRS